MRAPETPTGTQSVCVCVCGIYMLPQPGPTEVGSWRQLWGAIGAGGFPPSRWVARDKARKPVQNNFQRGWKTKFPDSKMPSQKPPANRRERCDDHMPRNEADVHQNARGALAHQASHIRPTHCSSNSKPRGWQPAASTSKLEPEPARPQPPTHARSRTRCHKIVQRLSSQLLSHASKIQSPKNSPGRHRN